MAKKKKRNPVLEKKYEEGREDQRILDVAAFSVRVKRIENIKGIGQKRMQMIIDALDKPFTSEEMKLIREREQRLIRQEKQQE